MKNSPWKVTFARGGKSKPSSDKSTAKERSKQREEDEEGKGGF